ALRTDAGLEKHREAVQHLSSQALQTQATLETVKLERAALEELRGQMREADVEGKQSLGASNALKGEARGAPPAPPHARRTTRGSAKRRARPAKTRPPRWRRSRTSRNSSDLS